MESTREFFRNTFLTTTFFIWESFGSGPMFNNMFQLLVSGSAILAIGMPGGMELVIVLFVVLLLFGNRLPGAMKSLGQSFVAFKKGIKEGEDENTVSSDAESAKLK